ncbi:SEC-C metal-binding domain-containing protein [Desulfoluna sp.]|uniref:YecA family protein n=1 Tax=Desulfoluna sp. TaxID=2045199 RepID=UPI0026393B5A|nr:SEC-C metal-binding domain-containing protein [Desulfoluna sp.]
MNIQKSEGFTETEKLLSDLCDRTFLKLWSYPNPFNENKDELCDLIAVFDKHVFIFFDRENLSLKKGIQDSEVAWKRWVKKSITAQIKTAHGAERYIKSGRGIFLDKDLSKPFPLYIDSNEFVFHKIIVAHGAKEACKNASRDNVYGILAIAYGDRRTRATIPFFLELERDKPVHVFDSQNLEMILSELDTYYDFTAYLTSKESALEKYTIISYCGEEDLLAHYYSNFDDSKNQHYIGTLDKKVNGIFISEGEWYAFCKSQVYLRKKRADRNSYFWDEIIQRTSNFTLEGTILGESPLNGKSAIHEMAKEPRFHRRSLSDKIIESIKTFPNDGSQLSRKVSFMPSFIKSTAYVFMQLHIPDNKDSYEVYREKRRTLLEIACGSAKNKFQNFTKIVGIAIDAPKFSESNSEDFILMDCSDWPIEQKQYYEKLNEDWNFFSTSNMKQYKQTSTEFPKPKSKSKKLKIGRNSPCPCGSGKKYKKCCL